VSLTMAALFGSDGGSLWQRWRHGSSGNGSTGMISVDFE